MAEGIPCDPYFYTPIYQRSLFPLRASEYPLCRERYGEAINSAAVSCPVAEKAASEEALWFHHRLFLGDKDDVDDILQAMVKIKENLHKL